jgi:DNA-binding NarL/FixJ family response regulator
MNASLKILIADDHELFVDGMRHILKKLAESIEITTANNAEDTIALLESGTQYDLILTDLDMPGMNGMSILQRMHEKNIWLPIVVVSAEDNANVIRTALNSGALGFIPKSHNSQQMLDALQDILDGDIYVPDDIQKQLDRNTTSRPPKEASSNLALQQSGISQRQFDVLKLLAQGYSNKQIATTLFLTEHTVKAHLSALFKILNAVNRTDCVKAALEQGILTD